VKGEGESRKGEGRWVAYNTIQKFASSRAVQSVPKARVHLFYFGRASEQQCAGDTYNGKKKRERNILYPG